MADEILSLLVRDGIDDLEVQVTGAVLIDAVIEGAIVFDGIVVCTINKLTRKVVYAVSPNFYTSTAPT